MDVKLIFQITLFKVIVILYFFYIVIGTFFSKYNFFHDNADFGFWTFVSFLMFSTLILVADFVIILLASKIFKASKQKIYVLMIQLALCLIVYFGLNQMFKNTGETKIEYKNQIINNNISAEIPTLNFI